MLSLAATGVIRQRKPPETRNTCFPRACKVDTNSLKYVFKKLLKL